MNRFKAMFLGSLAALTTGWSGMMHHIGFSAGSMDALGDALSFGPIFNRLSRRSTGSHHSTPGGRARKKWKTRRASGQHERKHGGNHNAHRNRIKARHRMGAR